jgi:hypothetical protein
VFGGNGITSTTRKLETKAILAGVERNRQLSDLCVVRPGDVSRVGHVSVSMKAGKILGKFPQNPYVCTGVFTKLGARPHRKGKAPQDANKNRSTHSNRPGFRSTGPPPRQFHTHTKGTNTVRKRSPLLLGQLHCDGSLRCRLAIVLDVSFMVFLGGSEPCAFTTW